MGFFMICLENYGRYMGEIIRKTGGDAILTLFASIFSRTPADFVLYFPFFFLNEKKLKWILWMNEITSKVTVTKSSLYDIFMTSS